VRGLAKKSGLGKGLAAIFAENTEETGAPVTLRISEIEPNRNQPRKEFDEEALSELADSIAQHGVLQPLLVRPILSGGYQIVAGERRWRAARMAGLSQVPVVIREMDDAQVMELALIENLQREDLSPLEEAMGYRSLMEQYDFTQEEISQTVGKSRPAVANALRLLSLPEELQSLIEEGALSAGHGRALLAWKEPEEMIQMGKKAAEEGLSVRQLEKMAQAQKQKKPTPQRQGNHYYEEVRLAMSQHLGRKVKVSGTKKKGELRIEFYGEEDLKNLLSQFGC
jgi:ParB family chromosome partitioning protein